MQIPCNASTRHHRTTNKIPHARNELSLLEQSWPVGPHRHPPILQVIANALGHFPWIDGKILLLKVSQNMEESSWCSSGSFKLTANFPSAGRHYAGSWRRKVISSLIQLWAMEATIMTALAYVYVHWCNSGTAVVEVTNHSLLGLKVCPHSETYPWNLHLELRVGD